MLRDRRAEHRFLALLEAQDLTPWEIGPEFDQMLQDEIERSRLDGECTRLGYLTRVPTDFGPDGLPTAWAFEVGDPVHDLDH